MAPQNIRDGSAGASARRERERRKARREDAVRNKHPRIGGLLLALAEPPAHERRWAHGAGGEEMVAQTLDQHCRPHVAVLHDRRIPGSKANIDHIAIAPTGVWVIDTKRYKGKIEVVKPPIRLGQAQGRRPRPDQARRRPGEAG